LIRGRNEWVAYAADSCSDGRNEYPVQCKPVVVFGWFRNLTLAANAMHIILTSPTSKWPRAIDELSRVCDALRAVIGPQRLVAARWLVAALLITACGGTVEGDIPPGQQAVPCGTAGNQIDTRQLLGLPEKEAVEFGRRHGCHVRVETRDGKLVATGAAPDPRPTIGVTIRGGHVDRLCLIHAPGDRCVPSLG
jgi:hypothetical protein